MTDPTMTPERIHQGLREQASGSYPLEAAVELLIRAGHAAPGLPWVLPCDDDGRGDRAHWHYIDFGVLLDNIGPLSGGERRLLRLAASLGGGADDNTDVAVVLAECISGLDRRNLDLVLAAIAHAAGSHQWPITERKHVTTADNPDGFDVEIPVVGGGYAPSLHPWPQA